MGKRRARPQISCVAVGRKKPGPVADGHQERRHGIFCEDDRRTGQALCYQQYQSALGIFAGHTAAKQDIRIIWYYEGDKMIILVDIGHHDILKQF